MQPSHVLKSCCWAHGNGWTPGNVTAMQCFMGTNEQRTCLQVLYKYPPDKPVISDVAAFCFPHGVQPMLLERTPSMSSLNQLIYSQRFQQSDDSSFIFLLKVACLCPAPPCLPCSMQGTHLSGAQACIRSSMTAPWAAAVLHQSDES